MTPLHHIGQFIRDLLLTIPMPMVRVLFVLFHVALLIWLLRLPRAETRPPEDEAGWASNLKVWASLSVLIQLALYSWL